MSLSAEPSKTAPADLVVLNAGIVTVDEDAPRAEALAVKDGRFVAVGSTDRITSWVGSGTSVIDAQGKTVTPGFIDAHLHPAPLYPPTSPLGMVDLSPSHTKTMADLVAALGEKARLTPEGQWVRGIRYEDTKLGRHPSRTDLDAVSTVHPILIGHSSGHVSVANSQALAAAKITRDTPDPPGGAFDRDEDGDPTGLCREDAANAMVLQAGPPVSAPTRAEEIDGMRRCLEAFLSKGITSIGDASVRPPKMELYQDVLADGPAIRVSMMIRSRHLEELVERNLKTGCGDDRLKIGAIKLFHGGSLTGRTCWLYEPYANRPDYCGIPPKRSQAELDALIAQIHEAGCQAAVHANGDREIDMVLDAIEKALRKSPRDDHRHRIEHCSVVNRRILERIKRLGVVLTPHSYIHEHGDKMNDYGHERCAMMHPNRSAIRMGIPVAGNSDYPVSAADPMLRIQSLVTRKSTEGQIYGPKQRITVERAVRVFTMGGAFASFEEGIKGSITPGKLADFVILSQDPTQTPPDEIKDIPVEQTFVAGQQAWP